MTFKQLYQNIIDNLDLDEINALESLLQDYRVNEYIKLKNKLKKDIEEITT